MLLNLSVLLSLYKRGITPPPSSGGQEDSTPPFSQQAFTGHYAGCWGYSWKGDRVPAFMEPTVLTWRESITR